MHFARLSSSSHAHSPRLHVGYKHPAIITLSVTTISTLGAGSETNCSNSNKSNVYIYIDIFFKDGELKCVDSFGVSSLEYARNGSSK